MSRMFEKEDDHFWYNKLQDLVNNYNDTFHTSIKMKPKDVNESKKFTIWGRLFSHLVDIKKPRYNIGDKVRVLHFDLQHRASQMNKYFKAKYRATDERGVYKNPPSAIAAKGKPPFSEEIFTVDNVLLGDPNVYKLYSDEIDDIILGIFYEQELSLVSFESHKDSEE